ncbi:TnsA-like heteromeric transposase endonuclease subunit [Microbacterium sp. NPDC088619]|uniref:TnsA-like heteromeric transposase endonuclease subunit n=1 Tax=Microbacterium sp. NPDC088619 TaxID=3364196 RepID=UPI00382028D6
MKPAEIARLIASRRFSKDSELHWVPRDHGSATGYADSTSFAPVDRSLGRLDWSVIDPMKVRVSKGASHFFTGSEYFWSRTRSHVWCESQFERDELMWLDFGGQVERVWSQPFGLVFGVRSPMAGHWHVPDFLLQMSDGSYAVRDVKPKERIDEHAQLQFDETARVSTTLGWHYLVLSGHSLHATRVVEWLSASRHDRCRPSADIEDRLLDAATHGKTRRELCELASPDCPPLACAWVDNLAWRRLLALDLSSVFNSNAVLTTAHPGEDGGDQCLMSAS